MAGLFGTKEAPKKNSYESDVVLGRKYRDKQTGIEGVATHVTFYQFACERVIIETLDNDKNIKEYSFDVQRLEDVETKQQATTTRTGGPGDPVPRSGAATR